MPRIVRTARGEQIDFDTIMIKQQLAQAPMNVEVARRKEFIDSKEGKARGVTPPAGITTDQPLIQPEATQPPAPAPADFEIDEAPQVKGRQKSRVEEPVPNLPER